MAILKPISAAISIGSGGPFGAEGPIIMTGGAVGSVLAQHLELTADERKTLLVAGAAAGMAATFNAPLASVLLAVELLLFEWHNVTRMPVIARGPGREIVGIVTLPAMLAGRLRDLQEERDSERILQIARPRHGAGSSSGSRPNSPSRSPTGV